MSAPIIHTVYIDEEGANIRLDQWLARLSFIPSRTRATELIEQGLVTCEGRKLKPSSRLPVNSELRIELPPPQDSELQPLAAPLTILFEDDDLLVIGKPSGLVVHPAAGHEQDTLVNILLHHAKKLSMGFAERRPGIVHRLDRDTSGILVVAKNDFTHKALAEQFRKKTIHRIYWALVHGIPRSAQGSVKNYLSRHPTDRKRFTGRAEGPGKWAVTYYRLLQVKDNVSWIECRLETGRTHQIRVHMSEMGHPILGDPVYGRREKNPPPRLALHACELGFVHPRTQQTMKFQLPWPEDLREYVAKRGFLL